MGTKRVLVAVIIFFAAALLLDFIALIAVKGALNDIGQGFGQDVRGNADDRFLVFATQHILVIVFSFLSLRRQQWARVTLGCALVLSAMSAFTRGSMLSVAIIGFVLWQLFLTEASRQFFGSKGT